MVAVGGHLRGHFLFPKNTELDDRWPESEKGDVNMNQPTHWEVTIPTSLVAGVISVPGLTNEVCELDEGDYYEIYEDIQGGFFFFQKHRIKTHLTCSNARSCYALTGFGSSGGS